MTYTISRSCTAFIFPWINGSVMSVDATYRAVMNAWTVSPASNLGVKGSVFVSPSGKAWCAIYRQGTCHKFLCEMELIVFWCTHLESGSWCNIFLLFVSLRDLECKQSIILIIVNVHSISFFRILAPDHWICVFSWNQRNNLVCNLRKITRMKSLRNPRARCFDMMRTAWK